MGTDQVSWLGIGGLGLLLLVKKLPTYDGLVYIFLGNFYWGIPHRAHLFWYRVWVKLEIN